MCGGNTEYLVERIDEIGFKELLDYYNDRHFILKNGMLDTTTNVVIITNICSKYNLNLNNKYQEIEGFALYPSDYFCPKSHKTGEITLTDNTVTIHHFAGSWLTDKDIKHRNVDRKIKKVFGKRLGSLISWFYMLPYNIRVKIKERGFIGTVKYSIKTIFHMKDKK